MRHLLLCLLICAAPLARADGQRAEAFDYYVMALSWSPNWCALEGDARDAGQCGPRHDHGWIMHGLWPQYERGWPSYCQSSERNPSRSETGAMTDIMGSGGLAWHQWKKHGRCSGLSSVGYFDTTRRAYAKITRPDVFRKLKESVRLPAHVIEEAFLEANADLEADHITITCKSGYIQEARICLGKDLSFRRCGMDVLSDCRLSDAILDPIR